MGRAFAVPENEAERLGELDDLRLLDAEIGPNLDALCEMARTMFGVPSAMVSLLDADTQWLKAVAGAFPTYLARCDSVCTHTILADDLMVVEDASADPRLRDSPLVTMPGGIRFYAGLPVMASPGLHLGAFCITDTKPRSLTADEATRFRVLAEMVKTELRLHASARRLEAAEHRFNALVNASVAMVWQMDGLGEVTDVSLHQAFSGADRGDYLGLGFLERTHPADREAVLAALDVCIVEGRASDWLCRVLAPDGGYRWLHVRCAPVEAGAGGPREWIASCSDVHDRKVAEEAALDAARHDALTGLRNRAAFQDSLDRALRKASAGGGQAHLLLVDLDNFKDINDLHGHDTGDEVLRHVTRRLLACVGERGTVARFGGDEFGVVVDGGDADMAADLGEAVLRAVEAPLAEGRRSTFCHASIGVASYPGDGLDPRELFKSADLAMYAAKGKGRNQVCRFERRMRDDMVERVRVVTNVREALAAGRIVPYYQPKVCLATGRITGFEALARWRHPTQGLLTPGAFAAAFDDVDAALGIGEAMLRGILDDLSDWRDRGVEVGRVAINLATQQFCKPDIAEGILAELAIRGLPPSSIEIEVTETVYLHRSNVDIVRALATLHAAGVAIALDDFGTGFASLIHLKQFPVDRVKIDRSFVSDIERAPEDAAIVRAITGLGHTLGMSVVAEGVETLGQATYLQGAGCDEAQGFLYAKAMAASRVPRFVEGWDTSRVTGTQAPVPLDRAS